MSQKAPYKTKIFESKLLKIRILIYSCSTHSPWDQTSCKVYNCFRNKHLSQKKTSIGGTSGTGGTSTYFLQQIDCQWSPILETLVNLLHQNVNITWKITWEKVLRNQVVFFVCGPNPYTKKKHVSIAGGELWTLITTFSNQEIQVWPLNGSKCWPLCIRKPCWLVSSWLWVQTIHLTNLVSKLYSYKLT